MPNLLDTERLEAVSGGDAALERQLLDLFEGTCERCIDALEAGQEWEERAHELKGAAYSIGADMLGDLCAEAETLGPEAQAAFVPQIRDGAEAVKAAFRERLGI